MKKNLPGLILVDNSLYPTGAIRSIVNYAEALQNDYRFVFVLPVNSTATAFVEAAGFKVYHLPFLELSKSLKSFRYLPRLAKNARKLLQIMQEENAQVIHINDIYNMVGCYLKWKKPMIPVVYHVRLLASSYIRSLYPYFAKTVKKYADKIVCVSEAVHKDIGVSKKSCVIYDSISINEKLPVWNGLQNPEQAHILYLSNFVRGKGQQFGLAAFGQMAKKYPQATLHFAGGINNEADQIFQSELKAEAQRLGIDRQVYFEEATKDVEAKMKNADIVLNLSESESFSMVSLEAMVYGVPLVVSDCGGPAEITDHGNYASLVPNKSAADAAAAMTAVLDNPEKAKMQAQEGVRFAKTKFDVKKSCTELLQLYQSIIA